MLCTIDLDPHDGDIDFFEDIERAFDLRLTQRDVGHWKTLGDIDATIANLQPTPSTSGSCPTLIVFHRLRRVLTGSERPRSSISPSTPLEHFTGDRPGRFLRQLSSAIGMIVPAAPYRTTGVVGANIVALAGLGAVVCLLTGHWRTAIAALALLPIGVLLVRIDRGNLPPGVVTMGDLARRMSALNRRALMADNARAMPGDRWAVIAAIAAEHCGLSADEIGPDTYLFRSTMIADRSARTA